MALLFLRKRKYILPALIALPLLLITVWGRIPHFLSFYHTNIGSYLLLESLLSNGQLEVLPHMLGSTDLENASTNLQAALRWDRQNSTAYRLLGHTHAASGQFIEAAHIIQHLNSLKPEDRYEFGKIGWIYQLIAEAIDLAPEQELSTQLTADSDVTSLQTIRAPSCTFESGNCPYEMALIAIVHPLGQSVTFMPETRFRVLFLPLSSEVRFPMHVLPGENAFTFYSSLIEKEASEKTKNIDVDVLVRQSARQDTLALSLNLSYSRESNGWLGATVDLSGWEDADIILLLRLGTKGGARNSAQGTSSSQPQIAVESLPSLAELWQDLNWDARLLVRQGDRKQQHEELASALRWYKRAAILEPEAGYIWERIGTIYEKEDQWYSALSAYHRVIESENKEGIASLARIYTKLAMIPTWRLGETEPIAAKSYLSSALAVGDFLTSYEEADTHYKLAEILWAEGAFEAALRQLQLAVQSDPTYIRAHVHLGWALYRVRGDVRGAKQELRLALYLGATGRQAYWAYRHLGVINWREGKKTEAIAMFENALCADPSSGQTLAQLVEEATGEPWDD